MDVRYAKVGSVEEGPGPMASSSGMADSSVPASMLPLCVNLRGLLFASDLLLEALIVLVKSNLLYLLIIPMWLLRGLAALKSELAARVEINPAVLAYNRELI